MGGPKQHSHGDLIKSCRDLLLDFLSDPLLYITTNF